MEFYVKIILILPLPLILISPLPWIGFCFVVGVFCLFICVSSLNRAQRLWVWIYNSSLFGIIRWCIDKFVQTARLFIAGITKQEMKSKKGLKNLGNTCFMNSMLQMLSRCPKLKIEIDKINIDKSCTMTQSIKKMLTNYEPSDVLAAARERNITFNGYNQQDSFEMFNTIVEAIKDEMIKLNGKKQSDEMVEEIIMQTCTGVRLFFGTFITVYKYSSCKHIECHFQRFSSITVPILKEKDEIDQLQENTAKSWNCFKTKGSNVPTTDIERGIIHGLMRTEKYTEEKLYCSTCKIREPTGICLKKMMIYEPPHIMVLHIDRFREDGQGGMLKRDDCVTYPEILNMDSFCSIANEESEKLSYRLFGVVAHSGRLQCGHYIAYIKTEEHSADWYDELCKNLWKNPKHIKDKIECRLEQFEDKDISCHSGHIDSDTEVSITESESDWYIISDSSVTPCKGKDVMNKKDAYILMYEKID